MGFSRILVLRRGPQDVIRCHEMGNDLKDWKSRLIYTNVKGRSASAIEMHNTVMDINAKYINPGNVLIKNNKKLN